MSGQSANPEPRRELDQRRLLELIQFYVVGVDVAFNMILKRALATADPFRAWQDGKVPNKGKLPPPRNGSFHFRGHECVIIFGSRRIEFEFGPDGRHDGFSVYYLRRHVELNKRVRRLFGDVEIADGVKHLEQEGLIFQPGWEPTPHLFYLTAAGMERLRSFETSKA